MGTTQDTITQLNSARSIVLKDPAIYPQVVPGVLPVISSTQPVELRRWGADFLAETFASPVIAVDEKQKLCLSILDTLKSYLSRKEEKGEEEDLSVVQSAVQCAASVYPLAFRHTIANPDDSETWMKMTGIKTSILRRMDSAGAGVRICCIKFVARVVQVQTPGLIADPRRPEQNETSLALVPRDHAVLPPSNLEAEASGLLDRLLGVLQENTQDALIATATLNALSSLVARRASISPKILNVVLSFNPLILATSKAVMDGKDKIAVKSMTRTTISFLLNVLKRNPNHAFAGRLQAQVERLRHTLAEVFSDQANSNNDRKHGPDEPIDGLDSRKRMRLEEQVEAGTSPLQQNRPMAYPPLPTGPITYAQLFTLSNDPTAAAFHVEAIQPHIVAQLVPPLLASVDQARLDEALNVVRGRVLDLQRRPGRFVGDAPADDDEEYDPFESEQVPNNVNQNSQQILIPAPDVAVRLPPPPPLSEEERAEYVETASERLFGTLRRMDEEKTTSGRKAEKGFNRVLGDVGQERDGWIALLARLATRTTFTMEDEEADPKVKEEGEERSTEVVKRESKSGSGDLPTRIRTAFHRYIMDDWRRRIDVAVAWLNEEWYADRLRASENHSGEEEEEDDDQLPTYTPLALSLLDSLLPYLDTKDGRYLIRFLSEIPCLPPHVWERIKKLAEDPERVGIATQALLYLIMLRPPVREAAIECAADIWRSNAEARAAVGKILTKWRPEVLQEAELVKQEAEG